MRLEELSRRCGLCSRSLSIKFKAEMGMGIPEYIHREKLREARYLLDYTDYTLAEIAGFLNYRPRATSPRFSKNTKAAPRSSTAADYMERCEGVRNIALYMRL